MNDSAYWFLICIVCLGASAKTKFTKEALGLIAFFAVLAMILNIPKP